MTKINKANRTFDARDFLGDKIYPGHFIAIPKNEGKYLDIGIVGGLDKKQYGHRLTLLCTKRNMVRVENPKAPHGYRYEVHGTLLNVRRLGYVSKGVVLIGNPLFKVGMPEVSGLLTHLDEMRDKFFSPDWKPGSPYLVGLPEESEEV